MSKQNGHNWRDDINLAIAIAPPILVCIKLLAVAGWDYTTAFGILAASGTTAVVTGALLALVPLCCGVLAYIVLPARINQLRKGSLLDGTIAETLMNWAILFSLLTIVSKWLIGLISLILAGALVPHLRIYICRRLLKGRNLSEDTKGRSKSSWVTFFSIALLGNWAFSSLHTPWMSPEIVSLPSGNETAFVLRVENDRATMLLAKGRKLVNVPADSLTHEYCTFDTEWWNKTVLQLFSKESKYPQCPE